jgi:ABC-type Fe3+/spermidine/putrescine transport system ATPase subunit
VIRAARTNAAGARSEPASLQSPADAAVRVEGIHHEFGEHVALKGLDLAVPQGEFLTLLGPSGSGKTTLLRIIAGLLAPTAGSVYIGGRDVTRIEVQHRNIGFVFQNYALFPHLTVQENIEFPLKVHGVGRKEREQRTAEVVELVHLEGFAARRPGELSGGQQQRVAIARALVFRPDVLLLDEPLGALDRRLRQRLGTELRRVQQQTQITAIYVTHDQEEAFILSDTVVVMSDGVIHQAGAPAEVYERPADLFVATFLGDTNVLRGSISRRTQAGTTLDVDGVAVVCTGQSTAGEGSSAICSVRPEDLEVAEVHDGAGHDYCTFGRAVIEQRVFLGSRFRLILRARTYRLVADVARQADVPDVGAEVEVRWRTGVPVVLPDTDSGVAGAVGATDA